MDIVESLVEEVVDFFFEFFVDEFEEVADFVRRLVVEFDVGLNLFEFHVIIIVSLLCPFQNQLL